MKTRWPCPHTAARRGASLPLGTPHPIPAVCLPGGGSLAGVEPNRSPGPFIQVMP
jgi:hypothetical protein